MPDNKNFDERQMKRLQQLLALLEPDVMTNAEFLKQFENVVKLVKQIEEKNIRAIMDLEATYKRLEAKLDNNQSTSLSGIKADFEGELARLKAKDEQLNRLINDRLAQIKDGEAGKDADETEIIKNVLEQIKLPEQKEIILDDAFEIRNKLETLNGEDRLRIEAINGLQEALAEIKSRPLKGGGGFSKIHMDIHIIDDETPTGTVNGVNTDFVLANKPNPTASLKVYKDGQRMKLAVDYTLSGQTITFLSAPLTDSLISVDYRI